MKTIKEISWTQIIISNQPLLILKWIVNDSFGSLKQDIQYSEDKAIFRISESVFLLHPYKTQMLACGFTVAPVGKTGRIRHSVFPAFMNVFQRNACQLRCPDIHCLMISEPSVFFADWRVGNDQIGVVQSEWLSGFEQQRAHILPDLKGFLLNGWWKENLCGYRIRQFLIEDLSERFIKNILNSSFPAGVNGSDQTMDRICDQNAQTVRCKHPDQQIGLGCIESICIQDGSEFIEGPFSASFSVTLWIWSVCFCQGRTHCSSGSRSCSSCLRLFITSFSFWQTWRAVFPFSGRFRFRQVNPPWMI